MGMLQKDRNGYSESLFDTTDGTCYLCGFVGDTARHEIFHGANRKLSKAFGLWIAVCPICHTRIHQEDNGEYLWLKEEGQERYENYYNIDHEEFRILFGRNYL